MTDREYFTTDVRAVAETLNEGGLAIVPTDTVYGVAASLDHPVALQGIYTAKRRGYDKPLPILIDSIAAAEQFASVLSPASRTLMTGFWPGQLTIVVPASANVPAECRAADGTVGLRMPDHDELRTLISMCGGALAVTSANRSGNPETTSAAAAQAELSTAIEIVLDLGSLEGGAPSTVVFPIHEELRIIRSGAIGSSQLRAVLGSQQLTQ